MRIAMEFAHLKPHDLAEALDVSPVTVSRYLNGGVKATRATIMAWGMRTGVSWRWILDGTEPDDGGEVVTIGYPMVTPIHLVRHEFAEAA